MRLGLQQIKKFAKNIELEGRSKFRTFDSLFEAIEKHFASQKPTFSLRYLQNLSAEQIRTLSKNLNIEGWTKDRRKNVLIQRILEKNAKSNKTKEKFQWEYLKSELKKIQQKPQKVRKPRKDRKPLKKRLPRRIVTPRKPWSFIFQNEFQNRKFGSASEMYGLKINRKKLDLNPLEVFQDLLMRIIKKKKMKDGDRIRIIITHQNLDNPISTL